MKQLTKRIFPFFLSLILMFSAGMTVLASGEGNIDGGGGGMGSGTATDVWHNQDGVRVTVVTIDGSSVSSPFDISNYNISGNILHFGKVSKLQYSGGASLAGLARPFHAIDEMDHLIGGFDGLLPYAKEIERCGTGGQMFKALA